MAAATTASQVRASTNSYQQQQNFHVTLVKLDQGLRTPRSPRPGGTKPLSLQ
jgi:hypothetical protein